VWSAIWRGSDDFATLVAPAPARARDRYEAQHARLPASRPPSLSASSSRRYVTRCSSSYPVKTVASGAVSATGGSSNGFCISSSSTRDGHAGADDSIAPLLRQTIIRIGHRVMPFGQHPRRSETAPVRSHVLERKAFRVPPSQCPDPSQGKNPLTHVLVSFTVSVPETSAFPRPLAVLVTVGPDPPVGANWFSGLMKNEPSPHSQEQREMRVITQLPIRFQLSFGRCRLTDEILVPSEKRCRKRA
jgi:hypothetical protein